MTEKEKEKRRRRKEKRRNGEKEKRRKGERAERAERGEKGERKRARERERKCKRERESKPDNSPIASEPPPETAPSVVGPTESFDLVEVVAWWWIGRFGCNAVFLEENVTAEMSPIASIHLGNLFLPR